MISYEVSIGFIIITVVLCSGSMNLTKIVMAQVSLTCVLPASIGSWMEFEARLSVLSAHVFGTSF